MSFLSRCVDRLASAFVTETVTDDGTRLLLALDPTLHGLDLVVVVGHTPAPSPVAAPAPSPVGHQEWSAPDDARSLF